MFVRLSHRLPQESHAKVTRLSQDKTIRRTCPALQSCVSWHSCDSLAIKRMVTLRKSCGLRKTNAWLANYNVSRMNILRVLRQPCVSCGCRSPLRKRKQIAKKMNMSKIRCGSLATLFFVRQSCGVVYYTVRLPHETKKFVVTDRCTAAARLM